MGAPPKSVIVAAITAPYQFAPPANESVAFGAYTTPTALAPPLRLTVPVPPYRNWSEAALKPAELISPPPVKLIGAATGELGGPPAIWTITGPESMISVPPPFSVRLLML